MQIGLLDNLGQQMRTFEVTGGSVSRYWANVRAGALAAAEDLGLSVSFVVGGESGDASQAALLRRAIDERADGIAIAPIDAVALEPLIAEARAAGIPLIAFDAPPLAQTAALGYIGTDNTAAGRLAGEVLLRLVDRPGSVALSCDSLVAANGRQRIEGMVAALAGSSLIPLEPIEDRYSPERSERLAGEIVTRHPDLVAAFGACGSNGMSWARAMESLDRSAAPKLVCFDIGADNIRLLRQGVARVVVAQREYDMGYRSAQLLAELCCDHGALAAESFWTIDTGVDLVTLERTPWSVAFADYLLLASRHSLFEAMCAPPYSVPGERRASWLIGMAEVGQSGIVERQLPIAAGHLLRAMLSAGRPQIVSPTAAAYGAYPDVAAVRAAGRQTLVYVPLLVRGAPIGMLCLESDERDACPPADLALLERVASAVAATIATVRLFQQAESRAAELELAARRQELLLQTIMELSSPVVPIASGVLVLPITGVVDSVRADRMIETLLQAISEHRAQVVIIDITGVSVVDTAVANSLVQAARAAGLLGADAVLVGITPAVAQTVVHLGASFSGLTTRADLAGGVAYALARLGGRIVYDRPLPRA